MNEKNNIPEVEFIYSPVVNYAIQQNRIPVIRRFRIENLSEIELCDLEIRIECEPEFACNWLHLIDVIQPKQGISVETRDFRLSSRFLSEMTERISGELKLSVRLKEELILRKDYGIEILPYDQWNGIGVLPEMMAAYVTPNHPEISKIIRTASEFLMQWTGNPSFDAYQSMNPDRVKKQMAAIYEAIRGLGIVYCSPPASFEKEGQRIRMCDTIFLQKLGTCIDMAFLYAGCLEAAGLNPLTIITKGHAFAGCWLVDQTFPDIVNDDVSLLKKRIAQGINEIVLVESTLMNAGMTNPFDESVHHADFRLANEDDFLLFVDIKRARFSGITPLPQRIKTADGWEIVDHPGISAATDAPEKIIPDTPGVPEYSKFSKQKLWERKLLDLSLRNNLLNLRVTQSTIQLISVKLSQFEDSLAEGSDFQIFPKPADWSNPNNIAGIYQAVNLSDPIAGLLSHELGQKRMRSYLTEGELSGALTKLYRNSRLSLEENGANTLYLAMGLLKWYETSRSEVPRFAPILLLPIELIRKSAQKGFIIRGREEETLMNITLLEMLRQDFGIIINGLEDLPRDDSGVDVKRVLNIVRHGIMSQSRWNVEEQVFLGNFSFNKFIMWNDIHNNAEKLKENKIAASLISGKMEWQEPDDTWESPDLDKTYHPADIAIPINADASQLEAICAAVQDKSFILHGPPGTGKSQTITNIIANALYKGKRVLFVAEKMAALSVVQKRLSDIGLDPFCLELHSNKTRKSFVLEQLQRAIEVVKKSSPEEYQAEADKLHSLRSELNSYVESLHKRYSFGFSLFECFDGYAHLNAAPDIIRFDGGFLQGLSAERFAELVDTSEELQNAGMLCGHPHNHPLSDIKSSSYSQPIKSRALEVISGYISLLDQFSECREKVCNRLAINLHLRRREQDRAVIGLIGELISIPDTPGTILKAENAGHILGNVIEISRHGIIRDHARSGLLESYRKEILQYDAEFALSRWQIASAKWFLPRWMAHQKLRKSLKLLSKPDKFSWKQATPTFELILKYKHEQEILEKNKGFLSRLLDYLWNEGEVEWNGLISVCESVIRVQHELAVLTSDQASAQDIRLQIANQLLHGVQTFRDLNEKTFKTFIDLFERIQNLEGQLNGMLHVDFPACESNSEDWCTIWKNKVERWVENIDSLRDWSSWNLAAEKACNQGLSPLVENYRNGKLKNEEVVHSFKKGVYRLGAEFIISDDPQLLAFNGKLFDAKIKKFKGKSKYFEELTKAELFSRLASSIPSFTLEAAQSSEIGILQRAIRNKGRGISVRKLFDLIPNLLPRLCPCMLMSPISVAQYFDVDRARFDLTIFDEASQMPTCEAVGAIARGKNVIVVGDPKQMPPTSFFTTTNFDEENAEKEDLESILDDCLALSIPSKHLLWHYRSKHESLIAFSNSNYYDNRLMTFPSPDDLETKVHNVYVPGHYDRGKTRQNSFEAQAIVDEVVRRLSDPVLSKRSIGIVTFSSVQQNLVEDMLNETLRLRPDLEAIVSESNEPVFIKNLENVQGDERDVILFSVGYGPDKEGRVSLNFGPLNRDGGWRRLNVAVSRARYEMIVFSTLRSHQIDIARTTSEGVAGIKAFLEYSEKGKMALTQKTPAKKSKANSFEKLLAEDIRKSGHTVHTDIGCSGYRIDLAIVNPEKPTEYLLGILTDGENYKSAGTASDREIVRNDVLKMLGWNIYRLWSPDWWDNPQKVLQEIIAAVKSVQNSEYHNYGDGKANTRAAQSRHEKFADIKIQGITQHVIKEAYKLDNYTVCNLPATNISFSDEFFNPGRKTKIEGQIRKVIQTEAPISQTLLSRRILNAWGISRLGTRLNDYLNALYAHIELKYTKQNGSVFYWRDDQDPRIYNNFRLPPIDENKRSADDLPQEEIAAAVVYILRNQISLPAEDMVKEAAHLLGYSRMGGNVEQSMKTGIEYALGTRKVIQNDHRLVLP